jgi:hypothetical protein
VPGLDLPAHGRVGHGPHAGVVQPLVDGVQVAAGLRVAGAAGHGPLQPRHEGRMELDGLLADPGQQHAVGHGLLVHGGAGVDDLRRAAGLDEGAQRGQLVVGQVVGLVEHQQVPVQTTPGVVTTGEEDDLPLVGHDDALVTLAVPDAAQAALELGQQLGAVLDDGGHALVGVRGGALELGAVEDAPGLEDEQPVQLDDQQHLALAVLAGQDETHVCGGPLPPAVRQSPLGHDLDDGQLLPGQDGAAGHGAVEADGLAPGLVAVAGWDHPQAWGHAAPGEQRRCLLRCASHGTTFRGVGEGPPRRSPR